jgi:WD40 repeat protein
MHFLSPVFVYYCRWVTKTCFWGRNTAISASTDRSIALWDARAGSAPVFVLRHHQSPVSDLYIESRNAFWMTSAGAEGTVATWDFRKLGCLNRGTDILSSSTNTQTGSIYTQTVRQPIATMKHSQILQSGAECAGPVMLAKGVGTKYGQGDRSVMSVGTDGFINEWDVLSGRLLNTHNTAHGNKVSCFKTFNENDNLLKGRRGRKSNLFCHFGGTITAAWDGKIRLRRMVSNKGSVK